MKLKKLGRKKYLVPIAVCLVFIFVVIGYFIFSTMSKDGQKHYILVDFDDTTDSLCAKVRAVATPASYSGFSTLTHHIIKQPRPGMYLLEPSTSAFTLFRNIRNGKQSPVMVPIPTVRALEDMARRLDGKLCSDSTAYLNLFNDSAKIAQLGFTRETLPALFISDTYDFFWTNTPDDVLKRIKKAYDAFWTEERKKQAKAQGLTPIEVATLASIVDSETNNTPEKPKVAGMYLNRLRKNMKLQADPTVKFALKEFGLRRILFRHLEVDSPYNTYKYEGLPPGPICIPTIAGLEAVLNPAEHDYLFMCANSDFSGTHIFAKTNEEHLKNARAYQNALNKRNIK